MHNYFKLANNTFDYRGKHTAPTKSHGAPMHDLTQIYPDDIYSQNAVRYYGDSNPCDASSIRKIHSVRNKPEMLVTVYRAVPKTIEIKGQKQELTDVAINPGDWVTVCKGYALQHCNYFDDCQILEMKVPAKNLYTDGNSIHEWGYDPA